MTLIEQFALRVLLPSPDPGDHERFQELRRRLRPFGFTLTPRGLYQQRTPGDLILSFSDSKIHATQEILRREKAALGERLRAIVVTDFERSTSGLRRLDRQHPTIEADLGSAQRVFRYLVQDPALSDLHPVLITGRSLWIAAEFRPAFVAFWETFRQQAGLTTQLTFRQRDGYEEVRGKGPWGPRIYVPLLTEAIERGLTRLLVGTRGLFGEGWDALSLNVLIDLTSTTTSTSVQQLRGRSLRKDPHWPHKVAHNWDVICVAPQFSQGDLDLKRLQRRHSRFWGVVIAASSATYWRHFPGEVLRGLSPHMMRDWDGQIARGLLHVEPYLALNLAFRSWKTIPFDAFTQLLLEAIPHRETTYRAWGIGEPYDNYEYRLRQVRPRDWRIRTVYTLDESVAVLWRGLRDALFVALGLAWVYFSQLAPLTPPGLGPWAQWAIPLGVSLFLGLGSSYLLHHKTLTKALRILLREQPPDAILLDMGRALLEALRQSGMISRKLNADYVRVVHRPDDTYTVELDYASPEDAATFIQAFGELLAPVRNQRYLILRTDARLPGLLNTALWRMLRLLVPPNQRRPAYHPVPTVLATHRKYANALARAWQRYVGGGELVYTRSPEGRRILYQARLQARVPVDEAAFTFWR